MWDKNTLGLIDEFIGHEGPVLCLQFDEQIIISGSYDSTIRVWNLSSGEIINTLHHHKDEVFCLRFHSHILVTGSLDKSIAG